MDSIFEGELLRSYCKGCRFREAIDQGHESNHAKHGVLGG